MQKMTSWVSNFFLIRIAILQMITVFVMTTSLWTTHTEAKSFRLWQLFLIKQVWNNYHLFCFLCVEKWKYVFFFWGMPLSLKSERNLLFWNRNMLKKTIVPCAICITSDDICMSNHGFTLYIIKVLSKYKSYQAYSMGSFTLQK